jgi:hypothetical protein
MAEPSSEEVLHPFLTLSLLLSALIQTGIPREKH